MVFCGIDGEFMGMIIGFTSDDFVIHTLSCFCWGGQCTDTHCLTPGKASPVILICPD